MFERYTEKARRTIFFARVEASRFGSSYIETEHLLLGLLREDRVFQDRLPAGAAEQIRQRIEERVPQPVQSIATSVDLPLSQDSRRALAYAHEEGMALRHSAIDCGHLLLGLLRLENSTAAVLLREFGIEYAGYREVCGGGFRNSSARRAAGPNIREFAAPLGDRHRTRGQRGITAETVGMDSQGGAGPPDRLGGRASAVARPRALRTEAHRQRIPRGWLAIGPAL